jgi:hypothetical protein
MAEKSVSQETKPREIVSSVIEQRKASLRYHNENFFQEWAEIYRNLHARTKPHRRWNNKKAEWEDDHDRTNVCVTDHFVMWRRGCARLTRNPPNLRVRGGPDSDKGQTDRDKTSAHLMYQWDRAESQKGYKKVISSAYALGWGVGKSWYDEVPIVRRLRRLTSTLEPGDFKNLANSNDPQIAQLVSQFGDRLQDKTPFDPGEMSQITAALGNDTPLNISTVRYKGPVLDGVFIGDVFPEPGFHTLQESAYIIENSMQDEEWGKYWMNQTSIDPRTGEEKPAVDSKIFQKVIDKAGSRAYLDEQEMTLRRRMRDEIELADPITAGKPVRAPKKRFMLDERHLIVDGHLCCDFIGEESEYLGRLWYPWDTYGRYTYNEMVLIPDLLGGIGQSTLRVSRFLMMLRNTRMNQSTDFINNKLLPMKKVRRGSDYTAYDVVRTGWGRLVEVDNPDDFQDMVDPVFPAEAWQDSASLQQQMQLTDPVISDFAPGTADNPQAGKFATTAALQAKASDSVTADTLDNAGLFIRDVVELHLWMDQQAMDEAHEVPKAYFERIDAVSIRGPGFQARTIKVDPMDLQQDYEILPEQGSTLAANDEFRVGALQQFLMLGERHPDIVNVRACITKLAQATPGINPEDVIMPPPPPQPPVPPVKLNISLAIKWEELTPDVQSAILSHEGLPTDLVHAEGVGRMIKKVSEAADHAANLESPVEYGDGNATNGTPNNPGKAGGNGGPSRRPPVKRV